MSGTRSKFVIRNSGDDYFWELVVRGEVVARSAKEFRSKTNARRSINSLSHHIYAPVVDDAK